jgi:hypothetical protein
MLQDILADEDQETLRWWCKRAKLNRFDPFRELAASIRHIGEALSPSQTPTSPMARSRWLTVCSNLQAFGQRFRSCVASA